MADGAIHTILRAAAPGHLDAVADHLQTIAPKSFTKSNSSVLEEIQTEQKQFRIVDPGTSTTTTTTTATTTTTSNHHPLVGPLTAKLQQYQQQNFAGKQGVTYRMSITNNNNNNKDTDLVVIHTYAEKMDVPNRISGYWKATWTVQNVTNDTVDMTGRVQVHSYAYEEGNAQVKLDKEFPNQTLSTVVAVPSKQQQQQQQQKNDDDEPTTTTTTLMTVQAIMKQITAWELEVLALLAAMNEGGTGEQLKSIRRVLPITKTKMKWDVIAQRSVKTLKKTAPQAKSKVSYGS
ncbi:F-actin capping protein alpha subunit [Nitzschia inconspicua]|uniref:F-actin-capping protein subunit alpha n=1 Tax=Nitzschia inconspicua TaxID=303405 RepID=A0A9K3LG18_9STRA|nr:F-actin capping protein alpha subunit [Nitzschia inconspicua]